MPTILQTCGPRKPISSPPSRPASAASSDPCSSGGTPPSPAAPPAVLVLDFLGGSFVVLMPLMTSLVVGLPRPRAGGPPPQSHPRSYAPVNLSRRRGWGKRL